MSLVVTSEGSTLGADAAAAYEGLNAAFMARFGKRLAINSGTRTDAEQEAIFRNSYRNYFIPGTSRRWWKGEWWYLRPGFATVAVPGASNHRFPPGKAADFGSGVQILGSVEHRWMQLWAGAWGWEWTGATFVTVEPWHWEKNFSWASTGSKPFEPEEDMTQADIDWIKDRLTDISNAVNHPTIGILATSNRAADHAAQADLELDTLLLKVDNAANISSDVRNWITDPNQGIVKRLVEIAAGAGGTKDVAALAAELRKGLGDELAEELAERLRG